MRLKRLEERDEIIFGGTGTARYIERGFKTATQRRPKYDFAPGTPLRANCKDAGQELGIVALKTYRCSIRDLPIAVLPLDGVFSHQEAVAMYTAADYQTPASVDTEVSYIVFATDEKFMAVKPARRQSLLAEDPINLIRDPQLAELFLPSMLRQYFDHFPHAMFEEYLEWLEDNSVLSEQRTTRAWEAAIARRRFPNRSSFGERDVANLLEPKYRHKLIKEYETFILLH